MNSNQTKSFPSELGTARDGLLEDSAAAESSLFFSAITYSLSFRTPQPRKLVIGAFKLAVMDVRDTLGEIASRFITLEGGPTLVTRIQIRPWEEGVPLSLITQVCDEIEHSMRKRGFRELVRSYVAGR